MVRRPKYGMTVAVGMVAVASGVMLPTLLRKLQGSPQTPEPGPPEVGAAAAGAAPHPARADAEPDSRAPLPDSRAREPESTPAAGHGEAAAQDASWRQRAWAYASGGLTATFLVLAVLAAGTVAWAWALLPAGGSPQPETASIKINFAPGHAATEPITVTLFLAAQPAEGNRPAGARLSIDLKGSDLKRPGWNVYASVPQGVHAVDPRADRISRLAGGSESVDAQPGRQHSGAYAVALYWNNLSSGPLQAQGADMTAVFPQVRLQNTGSPNSDTQIQPLPSITVKRQLQPGGNFTYVDGPRPDHQDVSTWTWDGQSRSPAPGPSFFPPMTIGAQSPSLNENSSNPEFQSGVLFGVAAGALIGAVQEFVTSARRKNPRRLALAACSLPSAGRHAAGSPPAAGLDGAATSQRERLTDSTGPPPRVRRRCCRGRSRLAQGSPGYAARARRTRWNLTGGALARCASASTAPRWRRRRA